MIILNWYILVIDSFCYLHSKVLLEKLNINIQTLFNQSFWFFLIAWKIVKRD